MQPLARPGRRIANTLFALAATVAAIGWPVPAAQAATWIDELASSLTGGAATIEGLSGSFPADVTIRRLSLRDSQGVYATIEGVLVDWSPTALFRGVAKIERLHAERATIQRLPVSAEGETNGGGGLPVGVEVKELAVDRLEIAAELAGGSPAALRLRGSAELKSLSQATVSLVAKRIDRPGGTYRAEASLDPQSITGEITIDEPPNGLVANLAGLPALGPLALDASLSGPRRAEQASFSLAAGPLHLSGGGTLDLVQRTLDIAVDGSAPAMAPAADVAWQSATLEARVRGAFAAPNVAGTLRLAEPAAAGARAERFAARFSGDFGAVAATADITGLRIPGPDPALLAGAPVTLRAEATLGAEGLPPVNFSLAHPLVAAEGRVALAGGLDAQATVTLSALQPFAALAGVELEGSAQLAAEMAREGDTTRLAARGTVAVTGGMAEAVALIGDQGAIDLAATLAGGSVRIDHLAVDGKAVHAMLSGSRAASGELALDWAAQLAELSVLAPTANGAVRANGSLTGTPRDLSLDADATIDAAFGDLPRQTVEASVQLSGLPDAPAGRVTAQGGLAGSPVNVAAEVSRGTDGAIAVTIEEAKWKSVSADGRLVLPADTAVPRGQLSLRLGRLADLQPLTGIEASGSLTAQVETVATPQGPRARVSVGSDGLAIGGTAVDRLALGGTIDQLGGDRVLALDLSLDGIRAGTTRGRATLTARGPLMQPQLRLAADVNPPGRGVARLAATASVSLTEQVVQVASLSAQYRGRTARLAEPLSVRFKDGLAIEDLRLRIGEAVIAASGRVAPSLDLEASARHISSELLSSFAPTGGATEGEIAVTADLEGTLGAPTGTIRITGTGFRGWGGTGAVSADFSAVARLAGSRAAIDARLAAGETAALSVTGSAPLDGAGVLDLRADGRLDLAMLDPFLTAAGRRVRGMATIDLAVDGTLASPQANGSLRILDGEVQDYVQGLYITEITAEIALAGGTARIVRFDGRAGPGTVSITGSAGILAPDLPIDVTMTTRNAKLPARDLVTALIDTDVRLHGSAAGRIDVTGRVLVNHADVQLPDRLPQEVATLDVRRPGRPPPPIDEEGLVLGLDLTLEAPQEIFVRGHGLDAEMGGQLHIGGSTAAPLVTGGFALSRGTFSVIGQTLQIAAGSVGFDGYSLTENLNPTLDFLIEKTIAGFTARLAVTGYADDPQIALSSAPQAPPDEVLARLLFSRAINELSPVEIVQIGTALAALTTGGGGFSPLAEIRKGLGLDVLSVGGAAGGGTAIEAGKYIANGIYVGTKQSLSGNTQAQVKIDLTENLKLETEVSAGAGGPATGATPGHNPGSSIGLTYEFEY